MFYRTSNTRQVTAEPQIHVGVKGQPDAYVAHVARTVAKSQKTQAQALIRLAQAVQRVSKVRRVGVL